MVVAVEGEAGDGKVVIKFSYRIMIDLNKWEWIAILFSVVVLLVAVFRAYRWKTKHKTGNTIIPQYEPYPGIKPMYTGILMDGHLDPRDITACIVYLAGQGYIKIQKTESNSVLFQADDYELTLQKLPQNDFPVFERTILMRIFNQPFLQGKKVLLSSLKMSYKKQGQNFFRPIKLKNILMKDLIDAGYYEGMPVTIQVIAFSLFWLLFMITETTEFFQKNSQVMTFVFWSGIACIILIAWFSRRRSKKGHEVLDYLKGFKLFLETTEKYRYIFHNSPEKNPEQFMEYLPYAVAFGVEEKWVNAFNTKNIPVPSWYRNNDVETFSIKSLMKSLNLVSREFTVSLDKPLSSSNEHRSY